MCAGYLCIFLTHKLESPKRRELWEDTLMRSIMPGFGMTGTEELLAVSASSLDSVSSFVPAQKNNTQLLGTLRRSGDGICEMLTWSLTHTLLNALLWPRSVEARWGPSLLLSSFLWGWGSSPIPQHDRSMRVWDSTNKRAQEGKKIDPYHELIFLSHSIEPIFVEGVMCTLQGV